MLAHVLRAEAVVQQRCRIAVKTRPLPAFRIAGDSRSTL
eukprot:SAG11_NODE_30832_length_297_cov_0.767677_1_plen_38_part_01